MGQSSKQVAELLFLHEASAHEGAPKGDPGPFREGVKSGTFSESEKFACEKYMRPLRTTLLFQGFAKRPPPKRTLVDQSGFERVFGAPV